MKKQCTVETKGIIAKVSSKGSEGVMIMTVKYEINSTQYEIKENIKLVPKAIKIGILTVGQKKVPAMGDIRIGATAIVLYNPDNPSEAYLRDNIGIQNV